MNSFTEDELAIAKSVDLVEVARQLGYTPYRIGHYYSLKEMDSIRIYDRTNWFRWSRQFDKGVTVVHRSTSCESLPDWM